MYNEGISRFGDLIDIATDNGVVQKTGSWYAFGEERVTRKRSSQKVIER